MVNVTQVKDIPADVICYGDGSDCRWGSTVNDTFTFGSVTATATYDTLFYTTTQQLGDGNMGLSKSYWFRSQCSGYANFVELAYAQGAIKAPVAAFYVVGLPWLRRNGPWYSRTHLDQPK